MFDGQYCGVCGTLIFLPELEDFFYPQARADRRFREHAKVCEGAFISKPGHWADRYNPPITDETRFRATEATQ